MKNEEFYSRIPIAKKELFKPEINLSNLWYYALGSVLVVFIAPFSITYKSVYFDHEMPRLWTISAVTVVILSLILLWFLQILPFLEKGKGYYLKGKFDVAEKKEYMGRKYLVLIPGSAHKIKVNDAFFKSVQEGDKVMLERTRLGKIRKIQRYHDYGKD